MTSNWKWRGLAALVLTAALAACSTDTAPAPVAAGTGEHLNASGRVQLHDKKGWSPVLFREPIQGAKTGDHCQFPGFAKAAQAHRNLVATIGEYDPTTCEGVMYFGDWRADMERGEKAARQRGGVHTDSVSASPAQAAGNVAALLENPACDHIGGSGTTRYRLSTEISVWGKIDTGGGELIDDPKFKGRVEYTGEQMEWPGGWECNDGESAYVIRSIYNTATWSPSGSLTNYYTGWMFVPAGGPFTSDYFGMIYTTAIGVQRACSGQPNQVVNLAGDNGSSGWPRVEAYYPYSNSLGSVGSLPIPANECGDSFWPLTVYAYGGAAEYLNTIP